MNSVLKWDDNSYLPSWDICPDMAIAIKQWLLDSVFSYSDSQSLELDCFDKFGIDYDSTHPICDWVSNVWNWHES